jgi:hypothetical protein
MKKLFENWIKTIQIEVQPTSMGIMLRQHKYTLDILCRAGMSSCKPVDTPTSSSKLFMLFGSMFSDPIRFCQIIGVL